MNIYNRLIRPSDFDSPDFIALVQEASGRTEFPRHRKYWEWGMVLKALKELGYLGRDFRALGLGTCMEPLSYVLSNYLNHVYRTDFMDPNNHWAMENSERIRAENGPTFLPSGMKYEIDRVSFLAMDATNMVQFRDESVDIVYSISAIEHFGNRLSSPPHGSIRCMQESERVLKSGGICLGTTELQLNPEPHNQWFRPEEFMAELVNSHSLRPIEPFDFTLVEEMNDTGLYLPIQVQRVLGHKAKLQGSIMGVTGGNSVVVSIFYAFVKE